MWGWLPGRVLSGSLNGSGPAGGSALAEGWAADRVSWVCSRGWLACLVRHERHARCGGLLGLLWSWWSAGGGCPRVLGVCGGGMLSGFWGSAPWLPGLSGAPDSLGVVGGLVVNCIVDASILL